ncbi:PREDICTED: protein RESTRICTED TEV MOVEMENT 2-like [Lupinus angustifolius]|uniref:protein RESTRICTED TEV MOVEMENT 2-like n=1 Tax=Lupinus angustifolius TaxID=3871 RepID=UPI00092EA641|nr:PREDICTED: protein RESTRICTED TEV MOVEMENT 2-like [Lupinus angustifolius]
MDTKSQVAAERVYEDFTPYYEWAKDEGSIITLLPGYRRDQLKVQVTSKPVLKIMGERQITENRWGRFNIEFPLPSDYDTENVTAKFEGGKLYIKFAKLDKTKETTNPPEQVPKPKETSQKVDKQNANNEVSGQEKETTYEKEKSKTETEAASMDKMAKKVSANGLTETKEVETLKAPQNKVAKPVSRSKTRLLDFTLSLGQSNQADIDDEALEDLDSRLNKRKKLVKGVVFILLAVGLGLYARNAFRSSHGGSKFQEL